MNYRTIVLTLFGPAIAGCASAGTTNSTADSSKLPDIDADSSFDSSTSTTTDAAASDISALDSVVTDASSFTDTSPVADSGNIPDVITLTDSALPSDSTTHVDSADAVQTSDASDAMTTGGAVIQNDVFWKDTSGNNLYSQGGGVIQVGNTYYWYGVNYAGATTYAANPTGKNSDTTFVAVTCYSSTDLAHWKFENNVLTAASIGATGWVGRVGAAYNPTTKNYVLVMQYTGNNGTGELFATSPTPNGEFTFNNVQATLTNVTNNASGDQSVFTDDDSQAYLVFSNANGRADLYVAPLRAADFLAVQPATEIYSSAAGGREGNCMYKYNGRYYINSSDLHGWNASHTYYISASNITGPYSIEAIIGNTDLDFSHVTQTGLFVTVKGTTQTTIIFGGDRWSDFAGNGIGYNQWTPLTFNGTAPTMQSMSQWLIDSTTGGWSIGPGNNYALNPSFEADRVAVTQPAGWVTAGAASANASGGHTGNWKWHLSSTASYQSSLTQTVAGLPNGTYTLSAWVQSSGGQSVAQLFASGFGGAEIDTSANTALANWTHLSVPGIQVSNGTCQIGIQTTATATQWLSVDDFTLTTN